MQGKYTAPMDLITTQKAIKFTKDTFERNLAQALDLTRVSAPLFVLRDSGLNDDLNGYERAVSFDILQTGKTAEVVHSLAKWKRYALRQYGFAVHKGLYTDMNAIRRDEVCDALHSIYVDQWDWEKVITAEDRTLDYLKNTVARIYGVIRETAEQACEKFGVLQNFLSKEITFVTTQELEDRYPSLMPSERETAFVREHGAAFICGIGAPLRSGKPHDGRAPDYDDWALNGDIVLYEISSMGIRVDARSLAEQLAAAGVEGRSKLPYHAELLAGHLPLTIGGGIGQSRLCMYILNRAHIGEVQASIWPEWERNDCAARGITLL